MSDHTKGPWAITRRSKYAVRISGRNWDEFAKVYVRLSDEDEDHEEGWANANLIAAAPEMLEALLFIRDNSKPDGQFYEKARAVIAKIEGRE